MATAVYSCYWRTGRTQTFITRRLDPDAMLIPVCLFRACCDAGVVEQLYVRFLSLQVYLCYVAMVGWRVKRRIEAKNDNSKGTLHDVDHSQFYRLPLGVNTFCSPSCCPHTNSCSTVYVAMMMAVLKHVWRLPVIRTPCVEAATKRKAQITRGDVTTVGVAGLACILSSSIRSAPLVR